MDVQKVEIEKKKARTQAEDALTLFLRCLK